MNFRKSASVLCLPYCALLIYYALFALLDLGMPHMPPNWLNIAQQFSFPLFLAYCLVPSPLGIAYFTLSQMVIILAWLKSPSDVRLRVWLLVYNSVLFVYVIYIFWWFATGQRFVYP